MNFGLEDKVIFITGASGGIGQDLIRAFTAEGARIGAHSRRGVPGSEAVLSTQGDVRDLAGLEAAMGEAVARFGRVDVCVANAGIWPAQDLPLHELPEAADRANSVLKTPPPTTAP